MPNVLIVSPISDVAGGGIGIKRAFDIVDGPWKARHVRGGTEYLDYPHDAEWSQLDSLWQWADLVHVMELPRYIRNMRPLKPVVIYHTGSRYRRQAAYMEREARQLGATTLAGSLDLCRIRGAPWLPIVADLDALAGRATKRRGRRVRVSHAPTNRTLKSTDLILETLAGLDVDVDLIEGVSNAECIARKARSDIYVDELTLGYGMNALECWALGVPVVSGIADPGFRAEALRRWGELPFVEATPDTLEAVLRRLLNVPGSRAEYADRGREFAYRWHSPEAVVAQLVTHYTKQRARFNRTRLDVIA